MMHDGIAALIFFVYVVGGLSVISFALNKTLQGRQHCEVCWHFTFGFAWIMAPILIMLGMR